jgi:hypothetical protein
MNSEKTIEERIQALETRPAPRGPAGDISAAVQMSQKAVSDAEARVQRCADAQFIKFRAEAAQLRKDFEALKSALNDIITNTVDNATVAVLRDYHLLDENCAPTHWDKNVPAVNSNPGTPGRKQKW